MFDQIISSVYTWLIGGGIGVIFTMILTVIMTKSKKRKWINEGREESFDDILASITNLTVMVTNMTEIFCEVFLTAKNVSTEIKADIERKLSKMKSDAVFKISKQASEVIALSREKTKEAKDKAKLIATEIKDETTTIIESLKTEVANKVGDLLK